MYIHEDYLQEMLAYEAFIRRAASLGLPFMLKGSYVTRQYFPDPATRIPCDMDWVYMERLSEVTEADRIFSEWATEVTESQAADGVAFVSFREDAFWRSIDYAMADDFPTVSTYLSCQVDGKLLQQLTLDISFHLDITVPPVPLLYKPLRGEPFTIPYTVALSQQVAWKLHQSLVRPRFKDLFDLICLLKHPGYQAVQREQSLQALVAECKADGVDIQRMRHLLAGNLEPLFNKGTLHDTWHYWRFGWRESRSGVVIPYDDCAERITDVTLLPETLAGFAGQLNAAFMHAGWQEVMLNGIVTAVNKPQEPSTDSVSVYAEAPPAYTPASTGFLARLRNFFRNKH